MIRAAALLVAIAAPVAAQVPCLPRDGLVAQLRDIYGEALSARFLAADEQTMVEIFTAAGSFTIAVTDAEGLSCMIAVGEAWTMQGVPRGEPG